MISVIVCFIIDVSGIIETIEWYLGKWLKGNVKIPKPFSCSLCMCFWLGLIWIAIFEFTLLNTVFVCLFAALSQEITNTIKIIKMLISKVQDAIVLWLQKQ